MKLVDILNKGEGVRENGGRVESNQDTLQIYIWKGDNEPSPAQLIHANTNI
jgi:hypothetical protein